MGRFSFIEAKKMFKTSFKSLMKSQKFCKINERNVAIVYTPRVRFWKMLVQSSHPKLLKFLLNNIVKM